MNGWGNILDIGEGKNRDIVMVEAASCTHHGNSGQQITEFIWKWGILDTMGGCLGDADAPVRPPNTSPKPTEVPILIWFFYGEYL